MVSGSIQRAGSPRQGKAALRLVDIHAEAAFQSSMKGSYQTKEGRRGILWCRFSINETRPDKTEMQMLITPILKEMEPALYCFEDGDQIISWRGNFTLTTAKLKEAIVKAFDGLISAAHVPELFHFYDSCDDGDALRERVKTILDAKQSAQEPAEEKGGPRLAEQPKLFAEFTAKQQEMLKIILPGRKIRKLPEILIVEDQDFSRKLLMGMLEHRYPCNAAATGVQALELYSVHAPDVVFLDIELPDINGHELAAFFKKQDPDSFIVMVTANRYARDIDMARANKVQGYISKPYNRRQIQDALDAFRYHHRS